MKYSYFFILFSLSSTILIGQDYSLTLKVIDKKTQNPVPGAIVFIDELHFNDTQTDDFGIAVFENLEPGKITLNIRKPGFLPVRGDFNITTQRKDNSVFVELEQLTLEKGKQNAPPVITNNSGQTVISIDQQGGITAGTVNLLNPEKHRKLSPYMRQQLDSIFLDPNVKIEVASIMGNQEAKNFAEEIAQHLTQKGFKNVSVGSYIREPKVIGQMIEKVKGEENHFRIWVGYLE